MLSLVDEVASVEVPDVVLVVQQRRKRLAEQLHRGMPGVLGTPIVVIASAGQQPASPSTDVHQDADDDQGEESGKAISQDRRLRAFTSAGQTPCTHVPRQRKQGKRGKRVERIPLAAEGQAES